MELQRAPVTAPFFYPVLADGSDEEENQCHDRGANPEDQSQWRPARAVAALGAAFRDHGSLIFV